MLVPHGTHVMVVDGSRYGLFRNTGRNSAPKLELVEQERDIVPRTSEIGTDQPGRGFQSVGGHRAAYEQSDYHQLLEDEFAAQACAKLETVMTDGEAQAILVAPPRVLGVMRKQLRLQCRRRLLAEIDKDYAGRTGAEVATMLAKYEP